MTSTTSGSQSKTRVLIPGGGFGGLYAALHPDQTIAADPDIEMTLVNRENFVLFTPNRSRRVGSERNAEG